MKPIDQTIFGDGSDGKERGNCFAACIASILELPLSAVPNFCNVERWDLALAEFLRPRGLFYMDISLTGDNSGEWLSKCGWHILSGKGPRGIMHSVVCYADKGMVHDPHPSMAGLCDKPDNLLYGFLVSINPRVGEQPEAHCQPAAAGGEG